MLKNYFYLTVVVAAFFNPFRTGGEVRGDECESGFKDGAAGGDPALVPQLLRAYVDAGRL